MKNSMIMIDEETVFSTDTGMFQTQTRWDSKVHLPRNMDYGAEDPEAGTLKKLED